MNEFKKQAVVWVLTIAVAISVFVNANNLVDRNVKTKGSEVTHSEMLTETEQTVAIETTEIVITEVEEEAFKFVEEEISESIFSNSEIDVIKYSTPVETKNKWDGFDYVPGTYITGKQADDCAIYQDNTIISVIDESSKTITLESGETFEYLYSDISHVTSYCPCVKCCDIYTGYTYSGRNLFEEETPKVLAADFNRYPLGTKIFVPGYGIAVVEDCGGAIDDRDLDVYIPDHDTAWNWGTVDTMVYIISFGEWN